MKESRNKKAGLLSLLCALLVIIIDVRTVNAETYEYAMFPSDVVYVSQTAYGSYSHSGKNVTDIVPNSDIKAPFSGTIRYKDATWGYVILESDKEVYYADGSLEKMCVGFMHDNNISDISVGQKIKQGQAFYQKGTQSPDNNVTGAHVHIICMRGAFTSEFKSNYSSRGNVYIYDAFYITEQTKITKSGYSSTVWKTKPTSPFAQYTSTGTSSNGFYRIIKGAGNLFEYPYSDSSVKGTVRTNIDISSLTANDVVEVVETVNNSLGNTWAKLRNGYFISMDNLEYLYTKEANVNLTATNTQKDLQTLPFADAIVGSTMSGSSMQVNLVEKYRNMYNKIWYKISSEQGGYFINVNNLSNITNNVTLTLRSGSTWPGNKNSSGSYPTGYPKGELEKGKIFGLRGIIDSNENISKVIATITNLSTGSKTSEDDTPNDKSFNFNGSSINDNLKFNELGIGSYRYTVTATTASGYTKTLIDEAFTVGSSTVPTLKVESIDIWYWGENVINGTILEYDDSDIGYQCSISAAVSPDSASNNITWSNSNSNVVTLDAANYNFVVKGFGTTTITVSSTDGSNITESITVEVTCRHLSSTWEIIQEPTYTSAGRRIRKCSICNETIATEDIPVLAPINVTSVTLSTHAVTLAPNQTYQLFVTVLPTNATYQNCRWQSSNPDVATVSSNGLVTAISAGSANIICRSEKDDGTLDIATITVEPSHGACGDALTWSLDNNTLTISGNGDMYIYAYTNNQPPWYAMRNKITSLVINNGVTRIGSDAFYNCYNLVNVSLPNSLLTIMDDAFAQCTSLVDVNLPSSITRIDSGAFADCTSLANIKIPDSVTTLNSSTFNNCTNITINTLQGSYADTYAQENNIPVKYYGGTCGDDLKWTIDKNILTIYGNGPMYDYARGNQPWSSCFASISEINMLGGSSIGDHAFDNDQERTFFTKVSLPDTLTRIGAYAFYYNKGMTSITIPDNVNEISNNAFRLCSSLKTISLPQNITVISSNLFYGCGSIEEVSIPDGVTYIDSNAFGRCTKLKSINLPNSLASISRDVFNGCELLSVIELPENLWNIGSNAFKDCIGLYSLYVPKTVTNLGDTPFSGCSHVNILCYAGSTIHHYAKNNNIDFEFLDTTFPIPDFIVPAALRSVEAEAFAGIAAQHIKLPDILNSIGDNAFANCPNLVCIYIPANCTSIASNAFDGVENLTIFGHSGSYSEFYAIRNGFDFIAITE